MGNNEIAGRPPPPEAAQLHHLQEVCQSDSGFQIFALSKMCARKLHKECELAR